MQTYRHIWEFSSRYILHKTKREKSRGHWRLDENRKHLYDIRNTLIGRKPIVHCTRKLRAPFLKAIKRTFYHFSGVSALGTLVIMHLRVVIYNFSLCFPNISCEFLRLKTDRKWKYCLDVNIFLHGIIFDMFCKLLSLGFRKFPASSILGCSQLFDTQQANTQGFKVVGS